jgi:hypothetical protein
MRRVLAVLAGIALVASAAATASASTPNQRTAAAAATPASHPEERRLLCHEGDPLCAETAEAIGYEGRYTGHDEPSVLFYSNRPGSGNNNHYRLILPKDPPTLPTQDGTGGTFNFQNRIAFWFGMDLCDNQSAPEFTHEPCTPNSDANIFDSADPASPPGQLRLHHPQRQAAGATGAAGPDDRGVHAGPRQGPVHACR